MAILGLAQTNKIENHNKKKIITSAIEHKCVLNSAHHAAKVFGLELVICPVSESGRVDIDFLAQNIDEETLLVSIKRVIKLQALESKTSLKSVIKQSINKAVKLASDLFVNRKEARTAIKLTAEEKKARKERQVTRYGREYREGLHAQIKEMKRNMEIVEAKKDAFRNYKRFVDQIDRDLLLKIDRLSVLSRNLRLHRQFLFHQLNLKFHQSSFSRLVSFLVSHHAYLRHGGRRLVDR